MADGCVRDARGTEFRSVMMKYPQNLSTGGSNMFCEYFLNFTNKKALIEVKLCVLI